jgi:hypothetical protein
MTDRFGRLIVGVPKMGQFAEPRLSRFPPTDSQRPRLLSGDVSGEPDTEASAPYSPTAAALTSVAPPSYSLMSAQVQTKFLSP